MSSPSLWGMTVWSSGVGEGAVMQSPKSEMGRGQEGNSGLARGGGGFGRKQL